MSQNRRDFLKNLGASAPASLMTVGFLDQLLLGVVQGFVNRAWAESQVNLPRNYFHIHLQNGWNRTVFDSFLTPTPTHKAADRFEANPGVGNVFKKDSSGNITGIEYKTFSHRGVEAPWMWQFDVRTGTGSRRPLSDLLENMAVIRGFNSGFDGHEFNLQKVTFPEPSGLSLSGALADKSSTPFSAIGGSGVNWFRSGTGSAISFANFSGNVLTNLRKSFDYTSIASTAPLTKKSQYADAIERATTSVKTLVKGNGPQANILKKNLENAEKLITGSVEDLSSIWNSLVLRYTTVINDSANPNILYPSGLVDIFDNPVVSPVLEGANPFRFSANGDCMHMHAGQDIRAILTTPDGANVLSMGRLAQHFAIAEYLFTRQLSTVYTTTFNELNNLNFKAVDAQSGTTDTSVAITQGDTSKVRLGYNTDEHDTGAYSSVLVHTCAYRGIGAAILEFREKMRRSQTSQGKNLWEETLIHMTSDFARAPKKNALGSDHGWWGHTASIFSGSFTNGPVITGNIQVQNRGASETSSVVNTYSGTWGAAAKVDFGSEKEYASLKHVLASISQVLRLNPNPWPFNNQFWKLDGNVLKAIAAQNIKTDGT